MNCSNCNERIDSDSVFCPNCGEKIVHRTNSNFNNANTSAEAVVQEQKKSKSKFILPIAIVCIALAVVFILLGPGKPETTVKNLLKSIDKVDPDMMLDSFSLHLKNEILDDIDWDKSELAYELSDMREDFRYKFGENWLKQVKVTAGYKDKNSAVVGITILGEYEQIRLIKEGKKWVLMEIPW